MNNELSEEDLNETALSERQRSCIDHWNVLLARLSVGDVALPSFPIWGDEILATYPFAKKAPYAFTAKDYASTLGSIAHPGGRRSQNCWHSCQAMRAPSSTSFRSGRSTAFEITETGLKRSRHIPPSAGFGSSLHFHRRSANWNGTVKAKTMTYGDTSCNFVHRACGSTIH